ncbi:MAG: c-type heme family protein, partial [Desulfosalsimonas sp.]
MKLRTIFFLMTTVLMVSAGTGIIWMVNTEMRQQALQEAESKARILLDRNLATHTYFTHRLKPELFEWSENFREPGYFAPVWMSSTYAVRQMQQYFKELNENDHYYKECAINARSPENEADDYERRFLERLNRNPGLTAGSGIRSIDGRPYFYVLRRGETMEESCLRCHSAPEAAPSDMVAEYGPERSFGRDSGEVVSAVSIRVPLEKAFANANRISFYLSGVMVMILAGFFAVILWFTRRFLFSPIDRIAEKSRQFTESGAGLGETMELPRGRELRELTETFNTMSIQLGRHMEELEEHVRSRTTELSKKNRELENAVAEQKRTAYLLEQSELKYRSMMEGMPDAVYICNPDYTVAYMNEAMIRRIGRDATGEPCHLAVHGLEEKCTWCAFESVKQGNSEGIEVKSPLDGRIYNITHAPIQNREGSVSKLSIYRDVTETRRMEEQFFRARKFEATAVMAGGIAHDFNNLMSVVLGYISM